MVQVPLPPKNAKQLNTVCQFCIVGCGYNVYRWPEGKDGGPAPGDNALGVDYRTQLDAFDDWIAPAMHSIVTDKDGSRHNIVIKPDNDCVVNKGLSSVRGGGLAQTLYSPDRATKDRLKAPMLKGPRGHKAISWNEATDLGSRVIKAVIDHWGPDAVGMKFFDHGGGGGGFENNWAVGRFFFTGVGTRAASIHNRPAYNSEVHAAGDAGVATLNNSYVDAQLADTIVVVGANPYETQTNYFLNHMAPNLQGDTLELKKSTFGDEPVDPGRMIIIDPRRTMTVATAESAAGKDNVLHLQIEPGTDIAVLNAIGRIILDRRWYDASFVNRHTERQTFEAYQRSSLDTDQALEYMVGQAAELCGVPQADLYKAASWIAKPKKGGLRRRALLHYEKGLIWGLKNYEGVASVINLALLSGNIGRHGTGASRLGGHQEGYVRPPYPGGRPALNVDEAVRRGEVKCYWVGGCNPVLTTMKAETMEQTMVERGRPVQEAIDTTKNLPIGERVARIVDALKAGGMFLMTQDIYMTATAKHAHLVLPAAQWGETELTSINGERRLRLYDRFMDPPGKAIPDWEIMARYARRIRRLYLEDKNPLMANRFMDFDWRKPEDVFIHARYQFKGNHSDPAEAYSGVTYDFLRERGTNGIQTPTRIVNGVISGTPRIHNDGKFSTSSGRARFIPASLPWPSYAGQVAEQRKKYRFWINNGRTNHIWQTSYHHQRIPFYDDHNPVPYIEMHAGDAQEMGIASGDILEIFNNVGTVRALAYITGAVKPGHTFMLFGHPRGSVGDLISDHVDPKTTIPYYKGVWADIRRIGPKPDFAKDLSFLPQNISE